MAVARLCHIVAALTVLATAGFAQSSFSAAVTVNTGVITNHDIDQRIALLTSFGATEENLERDAIEQLTDDELKIQLGDRLGVEVSDEAIAAGIAEFAGQRNLAAEAFLARNADFGIEPATMNALIRAGLVWRQVVQGRYRTQALPNEREIDDALNLAAAAARESIRLAEIILPFAERGQDETFAFGAQLSDELNSGADFSEAARSLSRARSAAAGGLLDWMPKDRLPPLIAAQALTLAPGQVTGPIPFPEGVVLLKLVDEREESADRRPDVAVIYGEMTLVGDIAALQARAAQLDTCADFRRLAASAGIDAAISEPVALPGLTPGVALRIARLDNGEADVIPTEGGASILFLCQRTGATDAEMRDQMRGLLFSRRISALGDGLLQELRRDAVIVIK